MKKINDPKKQSLIALKKAQSHLLKIQKMVEADEYCIKILEQLLAVNGLIKSASDKILKNHLETCFKDGIGSQDAHKQNTLIEEMIGVINLRRKN